MTRRSTATRFGGFTLLELMVMVAIVGIVTVVAVPAFQRYMRRSRTAEAIDELDKIYKGAAVYYNTIHVYKTGGKQECQFPRAQALTPAVRCCDPAVDTDGDGRCDSLPSRFHTEVWASLSFQVTDEVYYQYAFDSSGVKSAAQGTAFAKGDLDCDGTYSTFQRLIFGDPQATDSECSSVGGSTLYVENETE